MATKPKPTTKRTAKTATRKVTKVKAGAPAASQ